MSEIEQDLVQEEIVEVPKEPEIEDRYVLCKRWKRIVAFLIDFILFTGLIYVFNNYVTTPYIYKQIYKIDQIESEYEKNLVDYVLANPELYGTDLVDENGVWCEPAYNYYICEIPYGNYKKGDTLTYEQYRAAGVLNENAGNWKVDPCYEMKGKLYASKEYDDIYKDFERIRKRFSVLTQLIDSVIFLFLIYILPTIFFKNGRTLGKKIVGILVIDNFGKPIKPMMYLFRTVIGFWTIEYVSSLLILILTDVYMPLGILISGLITYINKKQKAIHDLLFGTFVVDEKKEERLVVYEDPKEFEKPEAEAIIDGEEYY